MPNARDILNRIDTEVQTTERPRARDILARLPETPKSRLKSEGGASLYDYDSAVEAGFAADSAGHLPSRIPSGPKRGLILKDRDHPTFDKTLFAEASLGNKLHERGGRVFSFPANEQRSTSFTPIPYIPLLQEDKGLLPDAPSQPTDITRVDPAFAGPDKSPMGLAEPGTTLGGFQDIMNRGADVLQGGGPQSFALSTALRMFGREERLEPTSVGNVAQNLVTGAAQFPAGMAGAAIEDPTALPAGLVDFIGETLENVETGLLKGGPRSSHLLERGVAPERLEPPSLEEIQAARTHLGERPEEPALLALPALKALPKAVRAVKPKARAILDRIKTEAVKERGDVPGVDIPGESLTPAVQKAEALPPVELARIPEKTPTGLEPVERGTVKLPEFEPEPTGAQTVSEGVPKSTPTKEIKRSAAQVRKQAKKVFGTTQDFGEAGYILPDGTMLDFSGRSQVGPLKAGERDFFRGERQIDHRELSEVFPKEEKGLSGGELMMKFESEANAVRFSFPGGQVNVSLVNTQKITAKQWRMISEAQRVTGEPIFYDIFSETDKRLSSGEARSAAALKVELQKTKPKNPEQLIALYERQKKSILKTGKIPRDAIDAGKFKNSSAYYDFISDEITRLEQARQQPSPPPTVEPISQEGAVGQKPPKPPVKVETPPEPPSGPNIGLNKKQIGEIRKEFHLDELQKAEVEPVLRTMQTAKKSGMDLNALEIADEIIAQNASRKLRKQGGGAQPRLVSAEEHSAMVLKMRDLKQEHRESIQTISDLADKGESALLEQKRAEMKLDQIDKLLKASDLSGREVARALNMRQYLIEETSYDITSIFTEARAVKGKRLTKGDEAKFTELAKTIERLEKEKTDIQANFDKQVEAAAEALADKITKREAVKNKTIARTEKAKTKLRAQREDIKKQIRDLGFRVNDAGGVTAEAAYLVGKLAVNYIREGALTLEQVVAKVRADIPELSARDVYESLVSKDPKFQRKARSDTVKRIAQMKRQSQLLLDIEKAEKGVFDPPKKQAPQSTEIAKLQERLDNLKKQAAREGLTPERVNKARETRENLKNQLEGQFRPVKKPKGEEGAQLRATKKQAEVLRRQIRIVDNIANIQEKLRTGDLTKAKRPDRPVLPHEWRQKELQLKGLQRKLTEARNEAYKSNMKPERLERAIQTINELQDQLTNQFRKVKRKEAPETAELTAAKAKIKDLRRQMHVVDELANLNEQLRTGDFVVREKPKVKERPPDLERKEIELTVARRNVRNAIRDMGPMTTRRVIGEIANFNRAALATADMSGWFRQNVVQVFANPSVLIKAGPAATKSFFSKWQADKADFQMRNKPHSYLYEKSGLELRELDGVLSKREESFQNQLIEKIPIIKEVVKASNRNMTVMGNVIRTSLFDDFLKKYPNSTNAELTSYARWLNITTGIGELGRFSAIAPELSFGAFAPKLAVSRFQTPVFAFKDWQLSRVRKQKMRDIVGFVGTGLTTLTLAKMAGFEVGLDLRESDFGKIRHGNTRIDVWGGFQQPARLVARIGALTTDRVGITGRELVESEKNLDPLELIGRFAAFKASPAVNLIREQLTGKSAVGEELTPTESMVRSVTPLVYQDIRDAWKDAGFGRAAAVGGLAFVGVGANTFEDSQTKVRRDIAKLVRQGKLGEAEFLRQKWNFLHPDDRQISEETAKSTPLQRQLEREAKGK